MTVYADAFTGTNGAAWPSPWVTSTASAGGTATIQADQGQMVGTTAAYDAVRAFYGSGTAVDVDITVTAVWAAAEQYFIISWRHSGAWQGNGGDPVTGYELVFNPLTPYLEILKNVAGVQTSLGVYTAFALTGTTPVKLRVQSIGPRHRVKVWDSDVAEPPDWALQVEDGAVTAAGQVALAFGAGVANSVAAWDDWSYDDAAAYDPLEHVQDLGTATSVTSGASLSISFTGAVKPQIGDLVVVSCARNDIANDPVTGDSISVSPGSNTFTRLAAGSLGVVGTQNDGAVGVKFWCVLTAAWPGGSNTLTWAHPTTTARSMQVKHYAKGVGYTLALVAGSDVTAAVNNTSGTVATGGTLAAGDLVVGSGAVEDATADTGDSDTTNGSWTPITTVITTGTTVAAMQSAEQHKWVTATGAQTWGPVGNSTNAVLIVAAWRATLLAGPVAVSARLPAGVAGRATAVKVATSAARLPVGAIARSASLAHAAAGRVAVGAAGRAAAVKVATSTGRLPLGATARASAPKVATSSGRLPVGVTSRASAPKVAVYAARLPVGVAGRSAPPAHVVAARLPVGVAGRAAAPKVAVYSGRLPSGVTGRSAQLVHALAARLPGGLTGRGPAAKVAPKSGRLPVGATGAVETGDVCVPILDSNGVPILDSNGDPICGSGAVGATVTARLSGGVTGRAATVNVRVVTGRLVAGATGRAPYTRTATTSARLRVGASGRVAALAHAVTARLHAGPTGRATAVKAAVVSARFSAGAAGRGGALAHQVGARLSAGVAGRAATVKAATLSARLPVGGAARAQVAHAATARMPVGVTGRAPAAKTATTSARLPVGVAGAAVTGKLVTSSARLAAGAVGRALAGARIVSARLHAGVAGRAGPLGRTAVYAARLPAGVDARGGAVKVGTSTARLTVGAAGRATTGAVVDVRQMTARVPLGATARAGVAKVAAGAGRLSGGLTARSTPAHTTGALLAVAVHGRGTARKVATAQARHPLGVTCRAAGTKTGAYTVRLPAAVTGSAGAAKLHQAAARLPLGVAGHGTTDDGVHLVDVHALPPRTGWHALPPLTSWHALPPIGATT